MDNMRLLKLILIALIVILPTARPTFPASRETRTFSLESVGVAFELPKRYSILQEEIFEGHYAVKISFGKEFRPSHLKTLDVLLVFWPGAYDGRRTIPEHKPSQYVDIEYQTVKEGYRQQRSGFEDPEYIKLFGNKAVRYVLSDFLCCIVVVGYLSANQLSGRAATYADEYLVRITSSGVDQESIDLFEAVVRSLRVIK